MHCRREPRPARGHLDAHRRERARIGRVAGDPLRAGTFVVEGEGRALVTATGAGTELGSHRRVDPRDRPARHAADERAAPARAHGGGDRRRGGRRVLRAHAAARHATLGRIPLRDRRHRGARSGGTAADGHPVVGDRRPADGEPNTPSSDGSSRSRRSGRPPSSAPTRPGRSRRTGCASSTCGRRAGASCAAASATSPPAIEPAGDIVADTGLLACDDGCTRGTRLLTGPGGASR